MGNGEATLEYTPTWVVALVCTVVVFISLGVQKSLYKIDKYIEKRRITTPTLKAVKKIKQELVLGLLALLLSVFQDRLGKICITEKLASHWLPCKKQDLSTTTVGSSNSKGYCSEGKLPLLSATAWTHLQIFIFVLASVHGTFSIVTILFAREKVRQWRNWENEVASNFSNHPEGDYDFTRRQFLHTGKNSVYRDWLLAFFKQFKGSVTKTDYVNLRQGFVMVHTQGNSRFDFHKFIMRDGEKDFKRVVGISWYLWFIVVIFLLVNVWGWHAYFWIEFIPFTLLLAVGTKLQYALAQMADEVAEKYTVSGGDLVLRPENEHFWFGRPRLVLYLIHVTLFQNSFQLAFFFWVWFQYSFESCVMGNVHYIILRLVIGVFIQSICSYSTFPLYIIVHQMGTSFNRAILAENIQEGLVRWAQATRKKRGLAWREAANGSSQVEPKDASVTVELDEVGNREPSLGDGTATEIEPEPPMRDLNERAAQLTQTHSDRQ